MGVSLDKLPKVLSQIKCNKNNALQVTATFTDLDKRNCILKGGRTHSAVAVRNLCGLRLLTPCKSDLRSFGMLLSVDW